MDLCVGGEVSEGGGGLRGTGGTRECGGRERGLVYGARGLVGGEM